MKTVTEMTNEEIIINCRDNAGQDNYIKSVNRHEINRQLAVMTDYNDKQDRLDKLAAEKNQAEFLKSIK